MEMERNVTCEVGPKTLFLDQLRCFRLVALVVFGHCKKYFWCKRADRSEIRDPQIFPSIINP